MKIKNLSDKMLLRYMLRYIVFVVFLMILIIPIYLQSLSIVKENLSDRFRQDIESGTRLLENEISIQRTIAERLKVNPSIRSLSAQTSFSDASQYYPLTQTYNYYKDLFAGLSLNSNSLLLFKNNDIVLEQDRTYDNAALFYGQTWNFENYSYEQLRKLLFSRTYYGEFVNGLHFNGANAYRSGNLVYVLTFSTGPKSTGCVLVSIYNSDALLEKCGLDKLRNTAQISISDLEGNSLYNSGEVQKRSTNIEYISPNLNLKFNVSIPDSYFTALTRKVLRTIYIYIITALLLGVCAAIFFAYRQFKPLARLVDYAGTVAQSSGAHENNAYSVIKSSIDMLKREHSEANHKLADTLFTNLVIKGLSDAEYKTLEQNIDFDGYYLVLLRNNDAENFYWLDEIFSQLQTNHIQSQYQTIINEKSIVMLMEADFACLGRLKNMLFQIITTEKWKLKLAVSGPRTSLREVTDVYRQLKDVIRYLDSSFFIFLDDLQGDSQTELLYEMTSKHELYEHIRNGDALLANKIVYEQWYNLSENPRLSNDIEQLFYLQDTILAQASKDSGYEGSLPEFNPEASVLELAFLITEGIDEIIAYINENKRSVDHRTEEILDFIDRNYRNSRFYMQDIADHFSLSPKTIGQMVKNITGMRYSNYIGKLRIDYAEKLLRETNIPINDVASSSGFDSSNAFYKAFKKAYYVSPSQYRSNRYQA